MTTTEVQPVTPAEGAAAPGPSAPSNVVELDNGHRVTLHPKVTIPLGVAALSAINEGGTFGTVFGRLAEIYLTLGIESWTFRDGRGQPEPITPDNIERFLPFDEGGLEVAERADALYQATVMRPLRKRYPERFQTGPTESSTPPSPPSGPSRRTRRGRSSPNGTAGKP